MTAAGRVLGKLNELVEKLGGPIVGVDPGGITGWVRYTGGGVWEWGTVERLVELEGVVTGAGLVVAEEFVLLPGKMCRATKNMVEPLRVLGVLGFLCEREEIELHTVLPSERAAVKELTGRVVGKQLPRHAREAAQVLVSCAVRLIEKGGVTR